jgi:hypothetical protein
MKTILFLGLGILMGSHSSSYARSYETNCFREHIQESIVLNKKRKIEYAALSEGQSDKIFTHLIAMEHLTLPIAMYYDMKAKPYKKKGLDLFCHEFMSMKKNEGMNPEIKTAPSYAFPALSLEDFKRDIKRAIKGKDDQLVLKISMKLLEEMKSYPAFHCMSRHMIESIYRFAYFVDIREKESADLGIDSPKDLLFNVMNTHLLAIDDSLKIDQWARPLQEKGIAILCSELPDLTFDLKTTKE